MVGWSKQIGYRRQVRNRKRNRLLVEAVEAARRKATMEVLDSPKKCSSLEESPKKTCQKKRKKSKEKTEETAMTAQAPKF